MAVDELVRRVEGGADVFLLRADSEGDPGPGVEVLRGLLEFETVLDPAPLHVERMRARPASDSE